MARTRAVRWLGLGTVVTVLVGLFAASWLGASAFQSPEQREAAAEPPAPSPVVEPVVTGRLADEVQLRADVGSQVQHSLVPSALPEHAVVTDSPIAKGDSLDYGDLVLEISGRPVFVLPGTFPFYRDLKSGMTGPDVEQLQRGLAAVGYDVADSEFGTFGRSTARAVDRYYDEMGYEPLDDGPKCSEQEGSSTSEGEAASPCRDPGPMVPRSEAVVTATELPAAVGGVPRVGTTLSAGDAVATLSGGELVARATATPQTAARLTTGLSVELITDDGQTAAAVVSSIDVLTEGEDSAEAASDSVEILITPTETLDAAWSGQDVLARIAIEVISEEALLVPNIAIALNPQGDAYVSVQGDDGAFTKVPVEVLGELAGQSAVRARDEGALAEGDLVRVA